MSALRRTRSIVGFLLAWFFVSLGVAAASPWVQPKAMQIVCTSAGAIKVIVQTDDGAEVIGDSQMDCPLCALNGAPPPPAQRSSSPNVMPLEHAVRSIPAARLAAATAAPLPARGPPLLA